MRASSPAVQSIPTSMLTRIRLAYLVAWSKPEGSMPAVRQAQNGGSFSIRMQISHRFQKTMISIYPITVTVGLSIAVRCRDRDNIEQAGSLNLNMRRFEYGELKRNLYCMRLYNKSRFGGRDDRRFLSYCGLCPSSRPTEKNEQNSPFNFHTNQ